MVLRVKRSLLKKGPMSLHIRLFTAGIANTITLGLGDECYIVEHPVSQNMEFVTGKSGLGAIFRGDMLPFSLLLRSELIRIGADLFSN